MLRRLLSILTAAAVCLPVCLGLSGCSGGGNYNEVKKAQEACAKLQSGKIVLTAGYERSSTTDRAVTEFVFKLTDSGNYAYSQTQYDRNNKAVYCEYSDGVKSEQWLIGKGWGDMGGKLCSPENPHRYLRLLSTALGKNAVAKTVLSEEDGNRRFDLALSPEKLNENVYQDGDSEAVEESVSVLLNDMGELICYSDTAKLKNRNSGEECLYTLEMQLTEQNTVGEIARPELREYS